MPNPLIFLVAIVVIDLVLKSVKNKKKVEEARRTSMDQTEHKAPVNPKKTSSGGSIRELRRMLEEELEKGKKQDVEKTIDTIDTIEKRKTRDDLIAEQRNKINKHSELEKMKRRKEEINKSRDSFKNGNKVPIREVFVAKSHKDKNEFREDLVKGIIFSEILGKPKSMKK